MVTDLREVIPEVCSRRKFFRRRVSVSDRFDRTDDLPRASRPTMKISCRELSGDGVQLSLAPRTLSLVGCTQQAEIARGTGLGEASAVAKGEFLVA